MLNIYRRYNLSESVTFFRFRTGGLYFRMEHMNKKIKVIAFDADDTLWINEPYFRDTAALFNDMFSGYMDKEKLSEEALSTEINNIKLYGYGIKGFTLSLIETACRITDNRVTAEEISRIIGFAKDMLNKPVILLEGVKEVIEKLKEDYQLIVATKGDLKDQERKLEKSGLESFFHHIEIMSDKKEDNYRKLLAHLDLPPDEFLMVGNSEKSDILPILNIGAYAVHIPFSTTWVHEQVDFVIEDKRFRKTDSILKLPGLLGNL